MNKQELIGNLTQVRGHINIDEKDQYTKGRDTAYEIAIELTKQLNEPELPVIPQFVANFIKGRTVSECFYYSYIMPNECNQETYEWINDNQTETARAILDGYTIEPEQPKTRQVLVKFFDNEEYKTELTEESAKELIEFLEANKK